MASTGWKIWDRDDKVELRTYKRAAGELPEMECTKQLVSFVRDVYEPGMTILDVGCAAGHYYLGLRRLDPGIRYFGVDATEAYITFAKRQFEGNANVTFAAGDIFALPDEFTDKFDIVYCCNVMLHLPSHEVPLRNLVRAAHKYCFVRTLLSDQTHLSQALVTDTYDEAGEPIDFAYQNTYSFDSFRKTIASMGCQKIEFIDDHFDASAINREFTDYNKLQPGSTRVIEGMQISGSKVFEWKWAKITK